MPSPEGQDRLRVVLATPTLTKPCAAYVDAAEAAVRVLEGAGHEALMVLEVGNPYISAARATMLRKAMDARADVVVFIDHDLSFDPGDILKLVETQGDVVAGLYRFKTDAEEYMGAVFTDADGIPVVRADGALKGHRVPAGFLKVTKEAVDRFMAAYPQFCYGPRYHLSVDLFNHGAHEGVWWGEDYSFSRNWLYLGESIWIVPDLNLVHHGDKPYPGNFHEFLMRQPGGVNDPTREAA